MGLGRPGRDTSSVDCRVWAGPDMPDIWWRYSDQGLARSSLGQVSIPTVAHLAKLVTQLTPIEPDEKGLGLQMVFM